MFLVAMKASPGVMAAIWISGLDSKLERRNDPFVYIYIIVLDRRAVEERQVLHGED